MTSERPVIVIGASGIDIKARPLSGWQMGTSLGGTVRNSVGGVARNVAENLARLEVPTVLFSAVGQDHSGDFLLEHTARAGVDTSRVLRLADTHTGTYVAIVDPTGQLVIAVSEYDIVSAVSPSYLQRHRLLFSQAAMAVIDANLSDRTFQSVFLWAKRYDLPVCADPTSQELAPRLIPYLDRLYLVTPDVYEAAALCGESGVPDTREAALGLAQCLVGRGVKIAIVTLGEQGVVYADGSSAGHVPAMHTPVVDPTGAGDALTAAVIFGLLNAMPLDEAVRLGVSAAALTLRTRETVSPDLNPDWLYDA